MIPYGQINDREKRAKWENYAEDCFDNRRFFIEEHLKIRTVDKRDRMSPQIVRGHR